jgi:hypothetical protein
MTRSLVLLFAVVSIAACAAPDEPARLDHAQIIAVRAEPAHVAPGGRARIDLLAGDDSGAVFEAEPDALDARGLAVEHTGDGWFVTAAPTAEIATLDLALEIDGVTWRATKALVVSEQAANPHVTTMLVDGETTDTLVAAVGSKPTLTAVGDAPDPTQLTYAWYSSVGDLEHYRAAEATLDAETAADGTIVVVLRDSVGGIDWQLLPARVE